MRFLHLSDFHLAQNHMEDFRLLFKPLISDIQEFHATENIDFIIISGDLVDKGGLSFDNRGGCFNVFFDTVIRPLQDAVGLSINQIYLVPGNHDVFQDDDDYYQEIGLQKELNSAEEVNNFIDSHARESIKRILPYKKFESDIYQKHPQKSLTEYQSSFISKKNGMTIGIACLNSSWRSYDSEKDLHLLLVGERQLTRALDFIEKTDIKIALIHHPVDWLADFDQYCVSTALERSFELVFCGHVHRNSAWVQTGVYGGIFISAAPCNWYSGIRTDSLTFVNGYSIIDFDPVNLSMQVHHRRFSYSKNKYVPNTDLGNDQGISSFQLPTTTELEMRKEEAKLVSNIKSVHFDSMNEHLITYNTDTLAPKNIKGLFVMPRVVEKIEYRGEQREEEKPLSIQEICTFSRNQIIFGAKEAGKTVLLDRIVLELGENLDLYKKIPVHFDFQEMGNRRIETLINRFLGIGITCVEGLLRAHKIVLLIDNMTFSSYDNRNLSRLADFLAANDNIQLIGASPQIVEGAFPVEIFDFPFFASMRKLHVKSFRTLEIRQLVKNWFSSRPTPDQDDKIEKLVRILLALNLPRTPLAISMFLWIIEQQENYQPINHATMLENFIEKLFLKHSRKEIYSDRFDYRNKERLLSEIAYEMLTRGLENYRLSSRYVTDFIDDYMRAKKFEFVSASDVLEHFLEKGILIEESEGQDTHIRFRFSCFLKYFLMRKMEYNPKFKEFVLDDSRFLAFVDELDYFTGIKRDADDILETVITRMEAEYKGILELIGQLPRTFDNIFDTHESFAAKADEAFMSRLTEQKKPAQSEIDQMQDEVLDKIMPEKGIVRKEISISNQKRMERLWALAAKVLKNTEETTKEGLKYNAYVSILRCSMAYATLWKFNIEKHIEANKENPEFKLDQELELQRQVLPLINQLYLFYLLGTTKLSVIFREKIQADEKAIKISDFERFITTFIYADIRGTDYLKLVRGFIKRVRHPHLVDMTLFKLISYYFFRSKTKESDYRYENMIGDLIVNAKKLKSSKKTKIIRDLRLKKMKEKDGSKKQPRLDK